MLFPDKVSRAAATGFVFFGVLVDQAIKYLAYHHLSQSVPKILVPRLIDLQLVLNYGAAYGLFQNQRIILTTVGLSFLISSFVWYKKIAVTKFSQVGLIFIAIGSASNLVDRIHLGYVVDFISTPFFPVFNFSDVAIDIGIACFVIELLVEWKRGK